MYYITLFVFITQFFNTGMLLTLVNANMIYQKLPLVSSLFDQGNSPDFNSNWFFAVGKVLVQTMRLN